MCKNAFTVLYDSNGRLAKAVDGKVGITYLYEYDSLDRLIRAYQKDASGNTIFAVENSYDEYGRAKGSKYVIDGVSRTYSISYKENTNLVSSYSTPGSNFTYTYDNFDRLTSKFNPLNAYGYSYKTGTSLVSSLTIATGISTSNQVNTTFDYTYNSLGYITSIKKNGVTIHNYEYDALGQLIREDDVVNSKSYVYAYDSAGNILKTYTFDGTGPNVAHWMAVYPYVGEITETYTYSTSAWGDLLTNYNGTNISYDSIGNPTNWIGISSLSWDGRELDNITISNNHTVDYTYNSDGIRTRKYEYNGNDMYLYDHSYVLDGSTILKETIRYSSAFYGDSTTVLEYYYDESGIASFRYNGTLYYYVKNLQGDVIEIIDNSGAVVVEYAYDAWGNILSVTGSLASTVGQINPFRYRGYYYDSETGLYYLNSRYYDAEVGRFISADGIIGANGGLQGYNMFAYCNNNSVNKVDPTGQFWKELWDSFTQTVQQSIGYFAVVAVFSQIDSPAPGPADVAAGVLLLSGVIVCAGIAMYTAIDTPAPSISIPQAKEKTETIVIPTEPNGSVIFPTDPNSFNPVGLVKVLRHGTKNGALISWMDPITNTEVFRWDENPNYSDGPHYHIHGAGHYYPGTIVPEPYATIYFPLRQVEATQ